MIGAWYVSQAVTRADSTAFRSSSANASSSAAVLIFSAIIHSRIFVIGSPDVSNASRSFVLYRSCEPLVECPCGCVISVTWISAGTCSRRTSAATSAYVSTSAG